MNASVRTATIAGLLLALNSCGGSGSAAKSGADADGGSGDSSYSGPGDGEMAGPQGPDCSDGTCFSCGEGICPTGSYCDQDAGGGPACAWLPECAGDPSCGCIGGVLEDCSCDDSGDGPTVSCQ